jgi:hypothetical protein
MTKGEATFSIMLLNDLLREYEYGRAECIVGNKVDNSVFKDIKALMTDLDLFGYSPENLQKLEVICSDPYHFRYIDFDPETRRFMGHA